MIKVVCDRCGKQIVDGYCRIKIVPYSLANSAQIVSGVRDVWGSASNAASMVAKPILEELNSTPLYCAECVEKIKAFIEWRTEG